MKLCTLWKFIHKKRVWVSPVSHKSGFFFDIKYLRISILNNEYSQFSDINFLIVKFIITFVNIYLHIHSHTKNRINFLSLINIYLIDSNANLFIFSQMPAKMLFRFSANVYIYAFWCYFIFENLQRISLLEKKLVAATNRKKYWY